MAQYLIEHEKVDEMTFVKLMKGELTPAPAAESAEAPAAEAEEAAAANLSELETYLLKLFSNGEMPESDAAKYDYAEISKRYLNLINKG